MLWGSFEVKTGMNKEELAPEFKLTHQIITKRYYLLQRVDNGIVNSFILSDHQNTKLVHLEPEICYLMEHKSTS